MEKLTHWLVRKLIVDYQKVDNVNVRSRYGALEAWTSVFVNLLLFVIKGFFGIMLGSIAIIGDAIHTLSDTGTSIIILIGFRIAKKPSDREHPFGHGRAESIAALIVAIVLIIAGIELFKSAVIRILHPQIVPGRITVTVAVVMMGTIVIKELMARFARELGQMIKSSALEADFWHHRSDAFSTVLVLVAMVCAHWNFVYVDGVAGASVALIIIYSGYIIARDAISPLLGEPPSKELLQEIEKTARSVPGVLGVHDVIVHRYGQENLISLHIEVPDDKPVIQLHDLSEEVEETIAQKMGGSAVVHLDPLNKNHKRYEEIHNAICIVTAEDKRIMGFHDLRIVGKGARTKAVFDITIDEHVSRKDTAAIIAQIHVSLAERLPDVRTVIKAEPRYAYSN